MKTTNKGNKNAKQKTKQVLLYRKGKVVMLIL